MKSENLNINNLSFSLKFAGRAVFSILLLYFAYYLFNKRTARKEATKPTQPRTIVIRARKKKIKFLSHEVLSGPYTQLGQGGFGTVYTCNYNGVGQAALKLFDQKNKTVEKKALDNESEITRIPPHQNIVTYYGHVIIPIGKFLFSSLAY